MLKGMPIVPKVSFRVQPLAAAVKLGAVNKIRLAYNLPPAINVPPAQITLTPAAPTMGGQNFLVVFGLYFTGPGEEMILVEGSQGNYLSIVFAAVTGKTYLADVAVVAQVNPNWEYVVGGIGPAPPTLPVTAQQGHLLIPFIATSSTRNLSLNPRGGSGQFLSAELTQVG
jgi:hypothetical protein